MAEGTRSQTTMREIEELLSNNASALNTSVDSKIAGVDSKIAGVDSKIAALDTKLEKKLSEMFEAIRLLSSSGLFTGERNSPPLASEERQSSPIFDPGGQRSTTPFQNPETPRVRSDDPISDLKKLEQTGGINEYYITFDSIRSRINLPEELLLGWFISGLRIETRKEVRTFRPKTVLQAYAIGRLYEAVHPVNSIADSSHSVSPQQPSHQTFPPIIRSVDKESNQQETEGACIALGDSCILFEIAGTDIVENDKIIDSVVVKLQSKGPNSDAHKLFEKMSETVLELKTISCVALGISVDERLIKFGFSSLIFDPGGDNRKRRLAEIDEQFSGNFSSKTSRKVEKSLMITEFDGMIEPVVAMVQSKGPNSYAHELFDEMSTPSLECVLIAEVAGGNRLMVPSNRESFVHYGIVDKFAFDPGGQEGIEMDVQAEFDGLDFAIVQWDPGGLLLKWELLHSRLYEGGREWSKRLFTEGFHLQLNASHRVRFNALLSWLLLRNWVLLLVYPESISKCSLGNFLKCGCVIESCYLPWPLEDTCMCFQLKLLPIHWDPGGCLLVVYVLQLMSLACSDILDFQVYGKKRKGCYSSSDQMDKSSTGRSNLGILLRSLAKVSTISTLRTRLLGREALI